MTRSTTTRRGALKTLAVGGAVAALPHWATAQDAGPIKIGFQKHATGIGASYGRWYDQTSTAAVAAINASGGINGRHVEMITEDDATDPARGAEVLYLDRYKVPYAYKLRS